MLGIDIAVWLALLLSLASVVLCVIYGWTRWNVGDEAVGESPSATAMMNSAGETARSREHT